MGTQRMIVDIEQTGTRFRFIVLGLGVMLAAGLLIHRLHELQVKEGEKYSKSLRQQTTMALLLSPARGGIYDRNGIGMAENQASMDIDVYLKELVGEYARDSGSQLPKTPAPWRPQRQLVDVPYILDSLAGTMLQTWAWK
jgi:cell division protein FtsI/penicillin-binding protein 2